MKPPLQGLSFRLTADASRARHKPVSSNNISKVPSAPSGNPNLLLHREVRSVYIGLIDLVEGASERKKTLNKQK